MICVESTSPTSLTSSPKSPGSGCGREALVLQELRLQKPVDTLDSEEPIICPELWTPGVQ